MAVQVVVKMDCGCDGGSGRSGFGVWDQVGDIYSSVIMGELSSLQT